LNPPSTDIPVSINNNTTFTSTIDITNAISILDLNIQLDIEHTRDGDLDVLLISEAGTRVSICDPLARIPHKKSKFST